MTPTNPYTYEEQPGFPPDGSEGDFIGFPVSGHAFLLKWIDSTSLWGCLTLEWHDGMVRPFAIALPSTSDFIIRHVRLPPLRAAGTATS